MSEKSVDKSWPRKELHSAIAREISGEQKVLPLIVGDSKEIFAKFPLLVDKYYLEWDGNADRIADNLLELKKKHPTIVNVR